MYEIHVVAGENSPRQLFKTNFADGFYDPEPIGAVSSRDCDDFHAVSESGDAGYVNEDGFTQWEGRYDSHGLSFESEPDEKSFVAALGRAISPFEGRKMPVSVCVYDSEDEMRRECAEFGAEEE